MFNDEDANQKIKEAYNAWNDMHYVTIPPSNAVIIGYLTWQQKRGKGFITPKV